MYWCKQIQALTKLSLNKLTQRSELRKAEGAPSENIKEGREDDMVHYTRKADAESSQYPPHPEACAGNHNGTELQFVGDLPFLLGTRQCNFSITEHSTGILQRNFVKVSGVFFYPEMWC